ncbi:MAG: amidohydrolase [Nitrospinae bacterium]|nr:amidohydrolase [Nitrospinota bacterium]
MKSNDSSQSIRDASLALLPWLSETRRTIHMNPELGYEEHETSRLIVENLERFGLDVHAGIAETGVVGLLETGRPGPTIGIRADMDALSIDESNDVPYKSRRPGKMHACGHDAHVSMLLGAARLLSENKNLLDGVGGNVKFIFQPAEEGKAGGKRMVEEGVLEEPRVDLLIAAHVWPDMPAGYIGTRSGPSLAAGDRLQIYVRGESSHAAYPHKSKDALLAACHLVTALQSIVSRNVGPLEAAVLSITTFESGVAFNIVPRDARITGTIRTHDSMVRAKVADRVRAVARGVAEAFDVEIELEITPGYPVLVNHQAAAALVESAGAQVLGAEKVEEMPLSMGAEDFSYMAEKRPGAMFRVGISNPGKGFVHGLHSDLFDLDEDALPVGVSVFAQAVVEFLGNSEKYLT